MSVARRDFEKPGVRVIERPDGFAWSSQEQPIQNFIDPKAEPLECQPVRFTPVAHAAVCAHHAVIVDSYNAEPIHVCTDPVAAGHQRFHRNPLRADEDEPDSQGDPEAEAAWEAERERQNQREEALIVAARVRRSFAQGLVRPSGMKAAEPMLRLAVRDTVLSSLDDSDVEELRALGEMLGVNIPEEIEGVGAGPGRVSSRRSRASARSRI
jgi:hypothetical protein